MRIVFLFIALSILTQSKAQKIDKVLHFQSGVIIGQVSYPIKKRSVLWGTLAGLSIAIMKEAYDYKRYGKFDKYDILATTTGALIGSLTTKLIKRFS